MAMDDRAPGERARRSVNRRTVTRTVAWTTPILLASTQAPAFAASCLPHGILPFPSSGQTGSGWTITTTGTTLKGDAKFTSSGFAVNAEPPSGETLHVAASSKATLVAGRTYRLTYSFTAFVGNPLPMTADFALGSTMVPGTRIDTTDDRTAGTVSVTFTVPTPAPASVQFRMHITSPSGGTTVGDDITITSSTLTCT